MADSDQFRQGLRGEAIAIWTTLFERQKRFAENAISQLSDEAYFARPQIVEETRLNSVAVIVQHMAGNMKSRWTEFLTTDGEKPWRDREAEFAEPEPTAASRAALTNAWEAGWTLVFEALSTLRPEDLTRTITIRTKPHSVDAAILRQLDHYATHVGQIVTTARLFVPETEWRYFTLRPGETTSFNAAMRGEDVSEEG